MRARIQDRAGDRELSMLTLSKPYKPLGITSVCTPPTVPSPGAPRQRCFFLPRSCQVIVIILLIIIISFPEISHSNNIIKPRIGNVRVTLLWSSGCDCAGARQRPVPAAARAGTSRLVRSRVAQLPVSGRVTVAKHYGLWRRIIIYYILKHAQQVIR